MSEQSSGLIAPSDIYDDPALLNAASPSEEAKVFQGIANHNAAKIVDQHLADFESSKNQDPTRFNLLNDALRENSRTFQKEAEGLMDMRLGEGIAAAQEATGRSREDLIAMFGAERAHIMKNGWEAGPSSPEVNPIIRGLAADRLRYERNKFLLEGVNSSHDGGLSPILQSRSTGENLGNMNVVRDSSGRVHVLMSMDQDKNGPTGKNDMPGWPTKPIVHYSFDDNKEKDLSDRIDKDRKAQLEIPDKIKRLEEEIQHLESSPPVGGEPGDYSPAREIVDKRNQINDLKLLDKRIDARLETYNRMQSDDPQSDAHYYAMRASENFAKDEKSKSKYLPKNLEQIKDEDFLTAAIHKTSDHWLGKLWINAGQAMREYGPNNIAMLGAMFSQDQEKIGKVVDEIEKQNAEVSQYGFANVTYNPEDHKIANSLIGIEKMGVQIGADMLMGNLINQGVLRIGAKVSRTAFEGEQKVLSKYMGEVFKSQVPKETIQAVGADIAQKATRLWGKALGTMVPALPMSGIVGMSEVVESEHKARALEEELKGAVDDEHKQMLTDEIKHIRGNQALTYFHGIANGELAGMFVLGKFLSKGNEAYLPEVFAFHRAAAADYARLANKANKVRKERLISRFQDASYAEELRIRNAYAEEKLGTFKKMMLGWQANPATNRWIDSVKGAIHTTGVMGGLHMEANAMARELYDKNRDIFDGLPETVANGMIIGGILGAVSSRVDPEVMRRAQFQAAKLAHFQANIPAAMQAMVRRMQYTPIDEIVATPPQDAIKQDKDGKWFIHDEDGGPILDTHGKTYNTKEEAIADHQQQWQRAFEAKVREWQDTRLNDDGTKRAPGQNAQDMAEADAIIKQWATFAANTQARSGVTTETFYKSMFSKWMRPNSDPMKVSSLPVKEQMISALDKRIQQTNDLLTKDPNNTALQEKAKQFADAKAGLEKSVASDKDALAAGPNPKDFKTNRYEFDNEHVAMIANNDVYMQRLRDWYSDPKRVQQAQTWRSTKAADLFSSVVNAGTPNARNGSRGGGARRSSRGAAPVNNPHTRVSDADYAEWHSMYSHLMRFSDQASDGVFQVNSEFQSSVKKFQDPQALRESAAKRRNRATELWNNAQQRGGDTDKAEASYWTIMQEAQAEDHLAALMENFAKGITGNVIDSQPPLAQKASPKIPNQEGDYSKVQPRRTAMYDIMTKSPEQIQKILKERDENFAFLNHWAVRPVADHELTAAQTVGNLMELINHEERNVEKFGYDPHPAATIINNFGSLGRGHLPFRINEGQNEAVTWDNHTPVTQFEKLMDARRRAKNNPDVIADDPNVGSRVRRIGGKSSGPDRILSISPRASVNDIARFLAGESVKGRLNNNFTVEKRVEDGVESNEAVSNFPPGSFEDDIISLWHQTRENAIRLSKQSGESSLSNVLWEKPDRVIDIDKNKSTSWLRSPEDFWAAMLGDVSYAASNAAKINGTGNGPDDPVNHILSKMAGVEAFDAEGNETRPFGKIKQIRIQRYTQDLANKQAPHYTDPWMLKNQGILRLTTNSVKSLLPEKERTDDADTRIYNIGQELIFRALNQDRSINWDVMRMFADSKTLEPDIRLVAKTMIDSQRRWNASAKPQANPWTGQPTESSKMAFEQGKAQVEADYQGMSEQERKSHNRRMMLKAAGADPERGDAIGDGPDITLNDELDRPNDPSNKHEIFTDEKGAEDLIDQSIEEGVKTLVNRKMPALHRFFGDQDRLSDYNSIDAQERTTPERVLQQNSAILPEGYQPREPIDYDTIKEAIMTVDRRQFPEKPNAELSMTGEGAGKDFSSLQAKDIPKESDRLTSENDRITEEGPPKKLRVELEGALRELADLKEKIGDPELTDEERNDYAQSVTEQEKLVNKLRRDMNAELNKDKSKVSGESTMEAFIADPATTFIHIQEALSEIKKMKSDNPEEASRLQTELVKVWQRHTRENEGPKNEDKTILKAQKIVNREGSDFFSREAEKFVGKARELTEKLANATPAQGDKVWFGNDPKRINEAQKALDDGDEITMVKLALLSPEYHGKIPDWTNPKRQTPISYGQEKIETEVNIPRAKRDDVVFSTGSLKSRRSNPAAYIKEMAGHLYPGVDQQSAELGVKRDVTQLIQSVIDGSIKDRSKNFTSPTAKQFFEQLDEVSKDLKEDEPMGANAMHALMILEKKLHEFVNSGGQPQTEFGRHYSWMPIDGESAISLFTNEGGKLLPRVTLEKAAVAHAYISATLDNAFRNGNIRLYTGSDSANKVVPVANGLEGRFKKLADERIAKHRLVENNDLAGFRPYRWGREGANIKGKHTLGLAIPDFNPEMFSKDYRKILRSPKFLAEIQKAPDKVAYDYEYISNKLAEAFPGNVKYLEEILSKAREQQQNSRTDDNPNGWPLLIDSLDRNSLGIPNFGEIIANEIDRRALEDHMSQEVGAEYDTSKEPGSSAGRRFAKGIDMLKVGGSADEPKAEGHSPYEPGMTLSKADPVFGITKTPDYAPSEWHNEVGMLPKEHGQLPLLGEDEPPTSAQPRPMTQEEQAIYDQKVGPSLEKALSKTQALHRDDPFTKDALGVTFPMRLFNESPIVKLAQNATAGTYVHEMVHWLRLANVGDQPLFNRILGEDATKTLIAWASGGSPHDKAKTPEEHVANYRHVEERIALAAEQFFRQGTPGLIEVIKKHGDRNGGPIPTDKEAAEIGQHIITLGKAIQQSWTGISDIFKTQGFGDGKGLTPEVLEGYENLFMKGRGADEIRKAVEGQKIVDPNAVIHDTGNPEQLENLKMFAKSLGIPEETLPEVIAGAKFAEDNPATAKAIDPSSMVAAVDPLAQQFTRVNPDDTRNTASGAAAGMLIKMFRKIAPSSADAVGHEAGAAKGIGLSGEGNLGMAGVQRMISASAEFNSFKTKAVGIAERFNRALDAHARTESILPFSPKRMAEVNRVMDLAMDVLNNEDPAARAQAFANLPSDALKVATLKMGFMRSQLVNEYLVRGIATGPVATVMSNRMAWYMHRSYEAFNNPEGWLKRITQERPNDIRVISGAGTLFESAARKIMAETDPKTNKPYTREEAESMLLGVKSNVVNLKDERNNPKGKVTGADQFSESTLDPLPPNVKQIMVEFLGGNNNPAGVFTDTINHLAGFMTDWEFKKGLRDDLVHAKMMFKDTKDLMSVVTDEKERAKFTQIGGDKAVPWDPFNTQDLYKDEKDALDLGPLHGMYVNENVYAWLRMAGAEHRNSSGMVVNFLNAINKMGKVGVTVLNPSSFIPNALTTFGQHVQGGHLIKGVGRGAYAGLMSDFGGYLAKAASFISSDLTTKLEDVTEHAKELRAMAASLSASESSLLGDVKMLQSHALTDSAKFNRTPGTVFGEVVNTALSPAKTLFNVLGKGFTQGDAVFKMAKMFALMDDLKKAFPNHTDEQINQEVQRRMLSTSVAYEMTPEIVKQMSLVPIGGTFLQFAYHIHRNFFNQIGESLMDIGEGQQRMRAGEAGGKEQLAMGLKGFAGMGAMIGFPKLLQSIFSHINGFNTDELWDTFNTKMVRPWDVNGLNIPLEHISRFGSNNEGKYINIGRFFPTTSLLTMIAKAIHEVSMSNDPNQTVFDTMYRMIPAVTGEMFQPFLEESFVQQAWNSVFYNKDAFGNDIRNDTYGFQRNGLRTLGHAFNALIPGLFTSALRSGLWKGERATKWADDMGLSINPSNDGYGSMMQFFTGLTTKTVKTDAAIKMNLKPFVGDIARLKNPIVEAWSNNNPMPADVFQPMYDNYHKSFERNAFEIQKTVQAFSQLVDGTSVRKILSETTGDDRISRLPASVQHLINSGQYKSYGVIHISKADYDRIQTTGHPQNKDQFERLARQGLVVVDESAK